MTHKKLPVKKKPDAGQNKTRSRPFAAWIALASIAACVLIAYLPATRNGITNWDDPGYITENPLVQSFSPDHIQNMFKTLSVMGNYHPLTLLSIAFDYQSAFDARTGHLDASVFHRTGIVIHLLNSLLVFVFIYLLLKKKWLPALLAAFIFGLHPMHVESVAWIAERKDVLYVFFYLLSLIAYTCYSKIKKPVYLALSFAAFAASVLSKAVAVTLPVVLLLIDFVAERRFNTRVWIEKLPFFAVSVVFGIIAIRSQQMQGAVSSAEVLPWYYKFLAGSYGFFFYIVKFFAPVRLSAYYPYPAEFLDRSLALPFYWHLLPWAFAATIAAVVVVFRKNRLILFASAFYLVTIALVLQVFSVGSAIVADRYSYLPYIGLSLILYAAIENATGENNSLTYPLAIAGVAAGVMLIAKTYSQAGTWKNNNTLWSNVIELQPRSEVAYKNRGNYFAREANDPGRAMQDYEVLMKMGSKDAGVWSNIGNIFAMKKEFANALDAYRKSMKYNQRNYQVFQNVGNLYAEQKIYDSALINYSRALALSPGNTDVLSSRAYTYLQSGNFKQALDEYTHLLSLSPGNTVFYMNRGIAATYLGRYDDAISDFEAVVAREPSNKDAWMNLSQCAKQAGRKADALKYALKAREAGSPVDEKYLQSLN